MKFEVRFDAEYRDKYDDKFGEAEYFLSRMRTEVQDGNHWPFTYDLRAFVSAARCIAEYAQAAAKAAGLSAEYYTLHDGDPVLEFFRVLRNENLHVRPAHAGRDVTVYPPSVHLRAPAGTTFVGNRDAEYTYTFAQWSGPGSAEVISLCERYVSGLTAPTVRPEPVEGRTGSAGRGSTGSPRPVLAIRTMLAESIAAGFVSR